MQLSQAVGAGGLLPPTFAAWLPNILAGGRRGVAPEDRRRRSKKRGAPIADSRGLTLHRFPSSRTAYFNPSWMRHCCAVALGRLSWLGENASR